MIFGNLAAVYYLTDLYQFKPGMLNYEGYNFYNVFINKPWSKFFLHSIGVVFSIAYWDLLKLRKLETYEERKQQYPKLSFWL